MAVDKGDDDIEAAVAGKIRVSGFGRKPAPLGLRCRAEQCAAVAYRNDAVALAVQD